MNPGSEESVAASMDRASGSRALEELAAARRDPRLDRSRGAAIADFWAAVDETDRVRRLTLMGLAELSQASGREEARFGVAHGGETELPATATSALTAAWERIEMAKAELGNGHPHVNAQALISLNSALDAMVEHVTEGFRAARIDALTAELTRRVTDAVPEAWAAMSEDARDQIREATRLEIETRFAKRQRLRGSGSQRYEPLLRSAGFAMPLDRPIPQQMDDALTEIGALRDVLVHQAGRVDVRALKQAPTLPYAEGQFVRISPDDYRRYSAALICYAQEIFFRGIRTWPDVTDSDGPDLGRWRDFSLIGS